MLPKETLYCPTFWPDLCMPLSFWSLIWQAIGIVASLLLAIFGIYKIYIEISKIRHDKDNQKKLEQTKFFLEQHRRLYDDPTLFEILSLIDAGDTSSLKEVSIIDKKRKFLTFLEEISILHYQDLVDREISFYMFGYYAKTTKHCKDFWEHFDTNEKHWRIFYNFVSDYEKYCTANKNISKPKWIIWLTLISLALILGLILYDRLN